MVRTKPTNRGAFGRFLQLIRFSHTIFALPFALGSLLVAADGRPSLRTLLLVLACMVFARTAAMLFNRLADWSLDQRNPRTAARHLLVDKRTALVLLVAFSAAFILSAGALNRVTGLLSPIALAMVFFYSLTKRFTNASHFFLGLALAIAPAAPPPIYQDARLSGQSAIDWGCSTSNGSSLVHMCSRLAPQSRCSMWRCCSRRPSNRSGAWIRSIA